jgi:peptidoglycan/LPS O-acetylase OafA/YrhL
MMALGTVTLLVGAHHRPSGPALGGHRPFAVLEWLGRLSYELYLFHLIVLELMRAVFPPKLIVGDEKLLHLAAFVVLSYALSAAIAHCYGAPLNRIIRRRVPSIPATAKLPASPALADNK